MTRTKKKGPEAPATTAQSLGALIKSCRDIMRKDKGLTTDLDRLPMLTWILFLKFLDDLEQVREAEAALEGKRFRPAIEAPYRWRDWASNPEGITGDSLVAFIQNDEAVRPDGTRGPGLFTYLRSLHGSNGGDRRDVVRRVFEGTFNRMLTGYLLRDVVNKVNGIHFDSSEEIYTLGHLYESMLKEMRDAAGENGEFYTPRPVVKFIVSVVDPRLGESVLDPAAGTGGFLAEAFDHLKRQCKTAQDHKRLQRDSLYGVEAKPLPYLLCQMNLLLHGVESPSIDPLNALRLPLREIGDKDRVDVIMTNPPFGGEEERGILGNFPDDLQTAETALLFLQLIMRKLRRASAGHRAGRCAVVVPNTTLFYPGVAARLRKQLLEEFNLWAVVRLPKGVFEPYTDIETNVLFFDRTKPSDTILFYRLDPPNGRKQYSKTQPLKYEELGEALDLLRRGSDRSPNAWTVRATAVLGDDRVSLDVLNPKRVVSTAEDPTQVISTLSKACGELSDALAHVAGTVDELRTILSGRDTWKSVKLGDVLRRRKDAVMIEDGVLYKRLRIQVKGRGVTLRDEADGARIGTKRQFLVEAGQFVLSKIDARNGAFGIVPEDAEGAVITGNFWAYDVDEAVIKARLLHHLTRSDAFVDFCMISSPGATNRHYLQEDLFLTQSFSVPEDLGIQDRLCDLFDTLASASRVQEKGLFSLSKQAPAILQSSLHLIFGGRAQKIGNGEGEEALQHQANDEAEE